MKASSVKGLAVSMRLSRFVDIEVSEDWCLTITDEASGIELISVHFNSANVSNMISNRLALGSGVFTDDDRIGKRRESQQVTLDIGKETKIEQVQRAAKKWSKKNPTWTIYEHYLSSWNFHNYSDGEYTVTARRYV